MAILNCYTTVMGVIINKTRLCAICENPLKSTQEKYCSNDCHHKSILGSGKFINKICPICEELFVCGARSGLNNSYRPLNTVYCSSDCSGRRLFKTDVNILPIDSKTAAYIAGLVDGEGSIMLVTKKNSYLLSLTITNSFRPVLDWVDSVTGLGVIRTKKRYSNKHKVSYFFQSYSYSAAAIIRLIQPYLIIKTEQANLGLAAFEHKIDTTDESLEIDIRNKMKFLNRRGVRQPFINHEVIG